MAEFLSEVSSSNKKPRKRFDSGFYYETNIASPRVGLQYNSHMDITGPG